MIMDAETLFADGTWSPTAVGDNISPNVLDIGPLGGPAYSGLGNTGRDLGQGESTTLVITLKQAITSGGAATVDFRIRTSSTANLTTAPVDIVATGPQPVASLVQGAQFKLKLPSATYKRFIGVDAVVGAAALTGGMIHAAVTRSPNSNLKYSSGYTLDV